MSERSELSGGLDKTVTWIWIEDGRLKVEHYDFSEAAQESFGNDVAYTLTVLDMSELHTLTGESPDSLVDWIVQNFKSYYGIKEWLEQSGIRFSLETESHA
jgi:hypothetical protein